MTTPTKKRLPHNFFDDAAPFKIDGVCCKLIPLTRGQFSIVLMEDYASLSVFSWHAYWDSHVRGFYARRTIGNRHSPGGAKTVAMARQIMGLRLGDGGKVDHRIPSASLDNRRGNLRLATDSQNNCNTRIYKSNTSGFKGVSFHKRVRKYASSISVNGVLKHLGYRDTAEAAHRELYVPAALRLHGEFARLR